MILQNLWIVLVIYYINCGCISGIFRRTRRWMDRVDTTQLNYGIAATDVNNDGRTDWFVAGYNGNNMVLTYDKESRRLKNIAVGNSPFEALMDYDGDAIGVCACDIDGDSKEEIYVLNTNNAYGGKASYGDKLFKWRNGTYVDLLSDPVNANVSGVTFAGRSVGCIDRLGNGLYSFIISTYSNKGAGKFALIEMDQFHPENDRWSGNIVLRNMAEAAGIDKSTGGRSVLVGPVLDNRGRSDIFFGNEGNYWMKNHGGNFLFASNRNGTFRDVAHEVGLTDADQNARGMAFGDFNEDGNLDIVVGNWRGNNRLYEQRILSNGSRRFTDIATRAFSEPANVRTVMVADFDNNGKTEIFFNNICDKQGTPQPNRLFRVRIQDTGAEISKLDVGDAEEPFGCGTGGSYADINNDGRLDILLSHGESREQPLTVYNAYTNQRRRWIRIIPKTRYGAPARGALVDLGFSTGKHMTQVIDGGSGYLCQMEPVAHFGLGSRKPRTLYVQWSDGKFYTRRVQQNDYNKVIVIDYSYAHF